MIRRYPSIAEFRLIHVRDAEVPGSNSRPENVRVRVLQSRLAVFATLKMA
jgi:hypothetical protein